VPAADEPCGSCRSSSSLRSLSSGVLPLGLYDPEWRARNGTGRDEQ
jgi:hypothetical protein